MEHNIGYYFKKATILKQLNWSTSDTILTFIIIVSMQCIYIIVYCFNIVFACNCLETALKANKRKWLPFGNGQTITFTLYNNIESLHAQTYLQSFCSIHELAQPLSCNKLENWFFKRFNESISSSKFTFIFVIYQLYIPYRVWVQTNCLETKKQTEMKEVL